MRRQVFSLSGILKIRQHKEKQAFQEFLDETQRDRELAAAYKQMEFDIYTQIALLEQGYQSLNQMQYVNDYISGLRSRQKEVSKERKELEPMIKKAREKYDEVRMELESMKILKESHDKKEHKRRLRVHYQEIQERIICDLR